MFIQTETTPNPASLKFLPGRDVLGAGTADFRDAAQARTSPLAAKLFAIDGVAGVFLGSDFVTITKQPDREWPHLKPAILGAVMEHFLSGLPVMAAEAAEEADNGAADGAVAAQIRELIDTRVRPAVAQDGGDIVFKGYDKGIVLLQMRGACSGCPSSTATLRNGIENMLRHYIPEIVEVRQIQG
jgi:Fe-S cluster biogenesis protein NfuA